MANQNTPRSAISLEPYHEAKLVNRGEQKRQLTLHLLSISLHGDDPIILCNGFIVITIS